MAGGIVRPRGGTAAEVPILDRSVAGIGGQRPRTRGSRIYPDRSVKVRGKAGGKR